MDKGKLDSIASWERDQRLPAFADAENVTETSGERIARGVPNVSNLIGTWVMLDVLEDTDTTNVISSSDEDRAAVLELYNTIDFSRLEVQSD